MKIIYLHQYFTTPSMSGGTRSYEMARRFVATGHEVHMITSKRKECDGFSGWLEENIDGIHVHWLHVPYSNEMGFKRRIMAFIKFSVLSTLKAVKVGGDVVFATSTPLTIAIPALVAKFYHQIPMVFEVRDMWPELPIAVGALRNPFAKLFAYWLEWAAYHASVHVIALSPGMATGVRRCGIPHSRVSVIPNSCDTDLFDVPAEKGQWVRNRLGLESGQPLIIYTGAFGLINGVGYLVDVAKTMRTIAPEVHFLLVGRGAEVDKVTEHAERMGVLKRNLWIWTPQPKVKVPDILAASTVVTSVVIPLKVLWNNSANKFFDALAAGKPVAINYFGWQADLLRKNESGVVLPPDNPAAAAKILAEFVRNPDRLKKAADASLRLAYENFNRDLLYAKLESVFKNSVARQ